MEVDEFIERVVFDPFLVKYGKDRTAEEKLIVGHNLAYDLGALSIRTGLSIGRNYGGLTVTLLEKTKNDPLSIKLANIDLIALSFAEKKNLLTEAGEKTPNPEAANAEALINEALTTLQKKAQRKRTFPSVAIKKLGFGKYSYSAHSDRYGNHLQFVDTRMLALAILGPGSATLKDLLLRLNITDVKKGEAKFDGPITPAFIDYCRDDVRGTWRVYQELRALYKRYGVSRPINRIYSEASIGKAHLKEFGITPFLVKNRDFDPDIIGASMEALYGGRADAHYVKKPIEVMVADFQAQYPAVNSAKMLGLQEFLIAKKVRVKRGQNTDAKRFLERVELSDFQRPETWRRLRGIALVAPQDDILPYRTEYLDDNDIDAGRRPDDGGRAVSLNIGVNKIKSACPTWFTFADVAASKILTGKCPRILETIELVPQGVQEGLKPLALLGEERFTIDPSKDDLFTRLVDLRAEIKREMERLDKGSAAYLSRKAEQSGIKVVCNATSFGILIEVVVDEQKEPVSTTVYHGGSQTRKRARAPTVGDDGRDQPSSYKAERAGEWFSTVGFLIPAAGRLLLAIAERLASDNGLLYAFTDTDAMAFARPHNMTREQFGARVLEIAGPKGWFEPLKPFCGSDPLFALEKVNYRLKDEETGKTSIDFEPLFALCIGTKRYVLYNRGAEGNIIIRKASQHGLGDIFTRHYDPLLSEHTSEDHSAAPVLKDEKTAEILRDEVTGAPLRDYGELSQGRNARFALDIWRIAAREYENGTPERINEILRGVPEFARPHFTQQTLSTAHAWRTYKNLPNKRAGMFFVSLPAPDCRFADGLRRDLRTALGNSSLYATFDDGFRLKALQDYEAQDEGNEGLYRRDTGQFPRQLFDDSGVKLITVAQRLSDYFFRDELKSRGRVGLLERKTVIGLTKQYIGKETNPQIEEADNPDEETIQEIGRSVPIFHQDLNSDALKDLDIARLAQRAKIHPDTLRKALTEGRRMDDERMERLFEALDVDDDGNLSIAAPRQETTGNKRRKRVQTRLRRGNFDALADSMLSAMRTSDGERTTPKKAKSVNRSRILDAINYVAEGYPPPADMPSDFLDLLDVAMNDIYGTNKAEARRGKKNQIARDAMAEMRQRRRQQFNDAWQEGEIIEPDPESLKKVRADAEARGFKVVRHIATFRTRGDIIMIPRIKGGDEIIANTWTRELNKAKTEGEFLEGIRPAIETAIASAQTSRENRRTKRKGYDARSYRKRRARRRLGRKSDNKDSDAP